MSLAELGFVVGDLVTVDINDECSGGIIYRIVHNCDPVGSTKKRGPQHATYVMPDGRLVGAKEHHGYVRVQLIFNFFPTSRGKKPKGKDGTLILHHPNLTQVAQHVDLITLGTKYLELGNMLRDIAMKGGMERPCT